MSAAAFGLYTIEVLWRRDLMRFLRQPSRIVGALGQPLIFWLVLGSGLSQGFRLPGLSLGYMEYFFPGVVVMVLLFASIFAAVSVIEDRHQGFLQAILAGPGSRASLVLGKCAGAATVAILQALVFVLMAPVAGFSFAAIHWPLLLATMIAISLGLTALGFLIAWLVDNVQGYHAIQMTLLVPLWMISGAMFPVSGPPVFRWLAAVNPVSYAVAAARQAFYGGAPVAELVFSPSPLVNLGVVVAFAAVSVFAAASVCERVRR
jgi:ABC-2 type transport system permease protein